MLINHSSILYVCVCKRERERASVCVRVCVCMCLCVCERERGRWISRLLDTCRHNPTTHLRVGGQVELMTMKMLEMDQTASKMEVCLRVRAWVSCCVAFEARIAVDKHP